jgi:hypothetical protein
MNMDQEESLPIQATLKYQIRDKWDNFTPGFTFIREQLTDAVIEGERKRLLESHPHARQILIEVETPEQK